MTLHVLRTTPNVYASRKVRGSRLKAYRVMEAPNMVIDSIVSLVGYSDRIIMELLQRHGSLMGAIHDQQPDLDFVREEVVERIHERTR